MCNHIDFVSVLDLKTGEQRQPTKISLSDFLNLPEAPNIVFLHGQPCPDWLRSIGARYDIDVEFFARHMEQSLRSAPERSLIFRTLPSDQKFPRLKITTMGSLRPVRSSPGPLYGRVSQDVTDRLRTQLLAKLKQCADFLRDPSTISTGDSMMRSFFVHDEVNFSFDQYISICVKKTGSKWIGRQNQASSD